ncbi:MAG: kelch repeat-containing protein [Bacteroidales bacterium]|jgi:hypothetical protein
MKRTIFTLICFLVIIGFSNAQSWIMKSPVYDYGRRTTGGVTMNGKGYMGLGLICDGSYVNDFWEYDTLTDSWMQLTSYPGDGPLDCIWFAINGKIYVGLGLSATQVCQYDLWEYNRLTNTWTKKRDFPGMARYGAGCFVIGDSAFVVAGSYYNGNDYLYDMYLYNPATDTWKQKADFPGGKRAWGAPFSIGGSGYFGVGFSSTYTQEKDFWKYDPVSNSWTPIPNFPGMARAANCFVTGNSGYIGFGTNNIDFFHDIWGYTPSTNSWSQLNVPANLPERSACFTFSFGDKAYIGNGINGTGILTDLWEFRPGASTGIVNHDQPSLLRVYPNPATYKITINLPLSVDLNQTEVSVYNAQGKRLLQKPLLMQRVDLGLEDLPAGFYLLKVVSRESTMTARFIKE